MTTEQDSSALYLNDLDRVSESSRGKLSNDERATLFQQLVEGGAPAAYAKNRLWTDALRLVPLIEARIRKGYGIEHVDADMLQEGNLAAGRAVETWDPAQGAFTTWVGHAVRGAMLDYINEVYKGGVGSKNSDVQMVDMYDSVAFSGEQTGTEDRPGMRSTAGGITRGDCLTYRGVMVAEDIEGEPVPEGYDDPMREAYRAQLREAILTIRDPLDQKILSEYYGFDGPRKTLNELAKELDYSVTGVRKRLLAAQEKVKKYL